jgi:hypothetical protein
LTGPIPPHPPPDDVVVQEVAPAGGEEQVQLVERMVEEEIRDSDEDSVVVVAQVSFVSSVQEAGQRGEDGQLSAPVLPRASAFPGMPLASFRGTRYALELEGCLPLRCRLPNVYIGA